VIRKGSTLARKHGEDLLKSVSDGLADETPLPTPQGKGKPKHKVAQRKGGPGMDQLLGPLKEWRNNLVQTKKLSPVVVANNQLLKEISRVAPGTIEELATVPGIRQWQVTDFGEEILSVITGVPLPKKSRKRKRRRSRTAGQGSDSPA
jgi:ribonuclease D